jgi:hypothetical protein
MNTACVLIHTRLECNVWKSLLLDDGNVMKAERTKGDIKYNHQQTIFCLKHYWLYEAMNLL